LERRERSKEITENEDMESYRQQKKKIKTRKKTEEIARRKDEK